MISKEEYTLRRNKLFSLIEDNSVTVLFSGVGKKSSGDENYKFIPNKNFYYLTGISQENSILLMIKNNNEKQTYLFIEEKDENKEKWTGYRMTLSEGKQISGVDNVEIRSNFDGKMIAFFSNNNSNQEPISKFYLDLEKELKIGECKSTQNYKKELEVAHNIEVCDIHDLIMEMREIKSEAEVEMICEAIQTTDLGLKNVLAKLAPGKHEYNLRNEFEFAIGEDQDSTVAFDSIVASGSNAIVLHYPQQKDLVKEDDLVLFDVGAQRDFYAADISRTYPVNGKFSGTQKVIYEIVLNCNKQTAKFMRPGITLNEANEFAKNFLASECFEKGLISSKDEIGKVYYHSVSHHLGLDTHDGRDRAISKNTKLVPGNVITCEPGLYFKDLGIGVRIEDDILITEEGSKVLSEGIIKEVEDIERMLKTRL